VCGYVCICVNNYIDVCVCMCIYIYVCVCMGGWHVCVCVSVYASLVHRTSPILLKHLHGKYNNLYIIIIYIYIIIYI